MMAADSNWWFVAFVVISLLVSDAVSSSSSSITEATPRGICVDGTYRHDGKDCCLCAVGMKVLEHCTTNLKYGTCDVCTPGQYNSYPNDQKSCEPCTSCSHPNENLEEDEPCTIARNAKCRCQKDHYCVSGTDTCKLCHPCQECGAEGIKVACAGRNNTVCNTEEVGIQGGAIAGIVIAIVSLIAVALVVLFFWRKRKSGQQSPVSVSNGNATDVHEMMTLFDPHVDLQPLLHDIAEVIGWKDMKQVAMSSKISDTAIESCRLDHPGDAQEQTIKLLKIWEESQGREAPRKLIETLQKSDKKGKSQRVADILARGNNSPA